MRVIIPGKKEQIDNFFFDEITAYSQNEFIYREWRNLELQKEDILLFQWPELIFDWKEPSVEELSLLAQKVKEWKRNNSIIYLVHNERRHTGMTANFEKLYAIVENSASLMVHFGEFSQKKYSEKYPEAKHYHIPHPLYEKTFRKTEKKQARKKLNIPEDRIILIAPGLIRSMEERELILKAFRYFPAKKKSLVVPRMLWKRSGMDFKGRVWLKKYIDVKKKFERLLNFFYPPRFYFSYSFNGPEELSIYMSAADAVFIPRVDILNSGNLYLGLSYRKPIAGPARGNLKEELNRLNAPIFEPESDKSIRNAMKMLYLQIRDCPLIEETKMTDFCPRSIAEKWDSLIHELS